MEKNSWGLILFFLLLMILMGCSTTTGLHGTSISITNEDTKEPDALVPSSSAVLDFSILVNEPSSEEIIVSAPTDSEFSLQDTFEDNQSALEVQSVCEAESVHESSQQLSLVLDSTLDTTIAISTTIVPKAEEESSIEAFAKEDTKVQMQSNENVTFESSSNMQSKKNNTKIVQYQKLVVLGMLFFVFACGIITFKKLD